MFFFMQAIPSMCFTPEEHILKQSSAVHFPSPPSLDFALLQLEMIMMISNIKRKQIIFIQKYLVNLV